MVCVCPSFAAALSCALCLPVICCCPALCSVSAAHHVAAADILESIFATPSVEPPSTAYSQPALHDGSTHSGHAFAHSTSLPAFSGMVLAGSSSQQQELLERLRGGSGVGGLQLPAGMESLVSLAAKQAAKEEELASLRSQVGTTLCDKTEMFDLS